MTNSTEEILLPFSSHLEDLRTALVRSLAAIFIGFCIALLFYPAIFSVITWPLKNFSDDSPPSLIKTELKVERISNHSSHTQTFKLPSESSWLTNNGIQETPLERALQPGESVDYIKSIPQRQLAVFGPVEGMAATFKVCFWLSVAVTSPLWLYFFLQFAAPALKSEEKHLLAPFVLFSLLALCAGLAFAFFGVLPLSSQILWAFNADIGYNLWSLGSYLDFVVFLLIAIALAFEISLVLFFLVHMGAITANYLREHRRQAIVLALIVAAILTPPDVPSQLMAAFPLIGFYEAAILYAKIRERKLKKAEAC
jgi:sec-independent protein translocase protein TatC